MNEKTYSIAAKTSLELLSKEAIGTGGTRSGMIHYLLTIRTQQVFLSRNEHQHANREPKIQVVKLRVWNSESCASGAGILTSMFASTPLPF
jgi:hypothetical protein